MWKKKVVDLLRVKKLKGQGEFWVNKAIQYDAKAKSNVKVLKAYKRFGANQSKEKFSYTLAQIYKNANPKNFSGTDFYKLRGHLSYTLDRGGSGIRKTKKVRKWFAENAQKFNRKAQIEIKGRSTPDRLVNARGQGVRFIRKNGRIIPIKPKRK